jgi:ABC-type sugar transport system ATPase subunit
MSGESMESGQRPLVHMKGITKRFGRVTVLKDVEFSVHAGEVHVLAGENGAGKSTLIKILAGVHTDFRGTIEMDGQAVRPASPSEAASLGVAVIHQELSLVPSMSVADNVFLGRPLTAGGLVRDRLQCESAQQLLDDFGLDVDARQFVERLPVATQQLIEIAKALGQNAKVIVMDEPTSALNAPEVEQLFSLIERLKKQGRGIVYITHKMEEIERIADRITVLRDGRFVASAAAHELPVDQLVRAMVGRDVDQQFPRHVAHPGKPRLQIEGLAVRKGRRLVVDHVSLEVRAGEIVGLAGLQGSGNSQLMVGLFDAARCRTTGKVWLDGERYPLGPPRRAISHGLSMLTNDRKANGLVLPMSIIANTTLAQLRRFSMAGWPVPARERTATAQMAESLHLRAASLDMPVGELSGGNQQKVALAKWILTHPRVLLLDEPTRGVDVGAKREIYLLMNEWTKKGIAILVVSSEMPELLAMSDRVVVMHRGQRTAEFSREEATPELVLEAAMGMRKKMV